LTAPFYLAQDREKKEIERKEREGSDKPAEPYFASSKMKALRMPKK
jgi:hypothetical protein